MNTATKSHEVFLVFAFSPCRILSEAIRQAKISTKAIAGDQTYLSHPPHLTLYVAAFDTPDVVEALCQKIVADWKPPVLEITGWHSFSGDVLTGNTTLVCNLSESSRVNLRTYQKKLIEQISPIRDPQLSSQRYRSHFHALTPERQKAVENFGFPFVNEDWIPHLTIASIEPERWNEVWEALASEPPKGTFHAEQLTLFELHSDEPQPWRTMSLLK